MTRRHPAKRSQCHAKTIRPLLSLYLDIDVIVQLTAQREKNSLTRSVWWAYRIATDIPLCYNAHTATGLRTNETGGHKMDYKERILKLVEEVQEDRLEMVYYLLLALRA